MTQTSTLTRPAAVDLPPQPPPRAWRAGALLVAGVLLLAACAGLSGGSGEPPPVAGNESSGTPTAAEREDADSLRSVAAAIYDAWERRDWNDVYERFDRATRAAISQDRFVVRALNCVEPGSPFAPEQELAVAGGDGEPWTVEVTFDDGETAADVYVYEEGRWRSVGNRQVLAELAALERYEGAGGLGCGLPRDAFRSWSVTS